MTQPFYAYLPAVGLVCALGHERETIAQGLLAGDTGGMVVEEGWLPEGRARVGKVALATAELPLVAAGLAEFDCRNNRLLLAALAQIEDEVAAAVHRYGRERIGVILGTSTSGFAEGETAFAWREKQGSYPAAFHYAQQEIGAAAPFLARHLGLHGPAYTISTACTSSAKALAAARNLLRFGVCDAVLAGGADSLCRLTVNGFKALESVSEELTNPMSRNRRGINIGEAAALFLVTREAAGIALLGAGESSDAYHVSAPDPEARGAILAMRKALDDAGLTPADIAYLNLHATATQKNDAMESLAVRQVFAQDLPCSGTKPLTGHALGAAGALEAAFCWLAIAGDGRLPPHVWDGAADPALPALSLVEYGQRFSDGGARICMSNSFAFGGNNASLIIGEVG